MAHPRKRIGIFGGTFDPIHDGHLLLARKVMQEAKLDRVLFLVSGCPPHKETEASGADRLLMVSLAVCNKPGLYACDIELQMQGKNYAVNSVQELKQLYPGAELYYILGSDVLNSVPYWYKSKDLCEMVTFLCVRRQGLLQHDQLAQHDLIRNYTISVMFLNLQIPDISSSTIRMRLRKDMDITNMLPTAVASFIKKKKLYGCVDTTRLP